MSNHKTHKSYETLQLDKARLEESKLKDQTRKEWLLKLYIKFLEEPGVTLGFQTAYALHV